MSKLIIIGLTLLLCAIICLQVLAALNIFPKQRILQVCPVNAISMRDGKAVIDATKCIGCKRCVIGVSSLIPPSSEEVAVPPQGNVFQAEPEQPAITEQAKETNVVSDKKQAKTETATVKAKPVKKAHKVNPDACIGCQLCVSNCPTQAITMVNGKAVIDPEKCINCGICVNGNGNDFAGCPVAAISPPQ